MTVFTGGEAIRAFLEEFDSWLSEPVDVYLPSDDQADAVDDAIDRLVENRF